MNSLKVLKKQTKPLKKSQLNLNNKRMRQSPLKVTRIHLLKLKDPKILIQRWKKFQKSYSQQSQLYFPGHIG